ncbi:MAG: hypothetical protein GY804_11460 [Alphaproteobacteria bacterium]|nr:hypothetical protein [Alphaproteobacteria bacterium]
MKTRNHRVIKKTVNGKPYFGIHEVFYNEDGSINNHTLNPVEAVGETIEDLREYIQWMLGCLDKEVLTMESLGSLITNIYDTDEGDINDFDDEETLDLDEFINLMNNTLEDE